LTAVLRSERSCCAAANDCDLHLVDSASLRAAEIANLTWEMVLDPSGDIGRIVGLRDCSNKKSGRIIFIHPELRAALIVLQADEEPTKPVFGSERGRLMTALSIYRKVQ
jgi:integrase